MEFGYARVSTNEQTIDPQIDRLIQYGIPESRIVSDFAISGIKFNRPKLDYLLSVMQTGDTLVVVKLDRLGRSLKNLIEIVEGLKNRGINFVSITEGMDTKTSTGRLLFNVFGAIAEFERDLMIERINAGIASAKKRGISCGKRPKLNKEQVELFHQLNNQGKTSTEIQRLLNISKATYYRYLRAK